MSFTWPIDRTGFPELPTLGDPPSDEYVKALAERNAAESLAVMVLHALTGRQFGLQEVTVRPCPESPCDSRGRYSGGVTSYLLSWEGDGWISVPCGCFGSRCRRGGPRAVHLPGPVHSVTEIKIAGVILDSAVWVVEGNVLYRRETIWPPQHLGRPAGEAGTWTVKYLRGIEVPAALASLAGILAGEFLAAVGGDNKCRLPRTVTVAARQGVTYRVYDPAVIYANGKTGLPEIDLVLASINPNHLAAAPTVI